MYETIPTRGDIYLTLYLRSLTSSRNFPSKLPDVGFGYDVDHNGYLNRDDFLCTALRSTVRAGLGSVSLSSLQDEQRLMLSLWEEIADIADLNQDGIITVEEFKQAVQATCVGKHYEEFPQSMKAFIESNFRVVDLNGDGVISADEFRYDCVLRIPVLELDSIDEAYNNLLEDADRVRGGLTLSRYQELYARFIGDYSNEAQNSSVYLFGPIPVMEDKNKNKIN
ncbi:sarcoplasmic calcium-binding protein 1-like, partial [Ctenocephalides felis]|uniref:sarcoplasmic calcium-binding protein 1-like n=1 Tax=Ctenocephalides felis TaxID=7515 RepID=UPI000E6E370D